MAAEGEEEFEASHTPFDLSKYEGRYEAGRIEILSECIPEGRGQRALDVGCGPGFYTRLLTSRGFATTSIDTDSQNLESARRFAAETFQGDAVEVLASLPASRYDFAIALEIIEHMPRSRGETLLARLHRLLVPGGRLLLSTPNRLSPEGLAGYYWMEKVRRKTVWKAWDPTHVHIYTSFEIIGLLRAHGFRVERATGYHYELPLPLLGRTKLFLSRSSAFPLNRFGFNLILECRKAGAG
jgi:2-polyprenyl-3-methyl-5-hydroxy-6-metoxy-1,4-benzoquinol methylase